MPEIRKLRSRPRSERSRITCPTRSPRSSARVCPISTPSGGSRADPATIAAPMSAIADTLSGVTPITPTGATACPRCTKALPLIWGDTAITPGVSRISRTAGCQMRICSRRLRSRWTATWTFAPGMREAGSRSILSNVM